MGTFILNRNVLLGLIILFSIPILTIIFQTFFSNEIIPNQVTFSFLGFSELLKPLIIHELFFISVRALIVSILATSISFIFSFLLVQYTSTKFHSLILFLLTVPFLINESIRIFSWQFFLSENGFLNKLLSLISGHNIAIFDGSNTFNIYIIMIISCIPIGIFINVASFKILPSFYWQVSNDLKINFLNRFFKIAIPLSKISIFATIIVIFFIAFSASSEVNFLGGDSKISVRNLILSLLSASKFQLIFTIGFVITLILICTVLFNNILRKPTDKSSENH